MSFGGDYFGTKQEAIDYYKTTFKNFEDKPDWLIESVIEFSIKYPNYKEYLEVERKVKNNIKLSDYETEKYGSLSWESKMTHYKKDQIIKDAIDIKDAGEYDDIARDPIIREKYNKYGLDFGKLEEPEEDVTIKINNNEGSFLVKSNIEDLNKGIKKINVIKCNE